MTKYDSSEQSLEPYWHTHLWEEHNDKDKKSCKLQSVEKCKFCHIIRQKIKSNLCTGVQMTKVGSVRFGNARD